MSTIYLVTQGTYSDYSVVGAFSDYARALDLSAILSDARVETYELDEYVEVAKRGLVPIEVLMSENGDSDVYRWENLDYPKCGSASIVADSDGPYLKCHCWASDEDHAVKIANEIRAQIIASNNWTSGYEWGKTSEPTSVGS